MKNETKNDELVISQCVYKIPLECGRAYIGETRRPLGVKVTDRK